MAKTANDNAARKPWIMKDTYKPFKDQVDCSIYAPALAKELGGTVLKRHWQNVRGDTWADIQVGDNTINIQRLWNKPTRVEVTITPANIEQNIRTKLPRRNVERATFDTTRDIAAVAKAIKTRVIDANAEILATIREDAKRIEGDENALVKASEELKKLFGNKLTVTVSSDKSSCALWGAGHEYFSGRLNADGSIYFDRIGSLNADKARRILAIILE